MTNVCIVAGMPRAATTYLYQTLADHPGAFVPARKELEFYSINFERGADWYQSFFADCTQEQVGFDISPIYFFSDLAIERISAKDVVSKAILIVRKPSEFVLSWYKNRLVGDPNLPAFENFLTGHGYVKDGVTVNIDLSPGQIPARIERFVEALGERLLVLDYADVDAHPVAALQAIEAFAGVGSYFTEETLDTDPVNASNQQPNRVIAYLSHKKWFADLVTTLLPRSLILYIRSRIQSTTRSKPVLEEAEEAACKARISELYAADDATVAAIVERYALKLDV